MTDSSPDQHAPIGIDELVALARIVAGVTGRARIHRRRASSECRLERGGSPR